MSIYTPLGGRRGADAYGASARGSRGGGGAGGGRGAGAGAGGADEGLSEEERALLAVLMGDHENEKLFQILCNYLSLAQFELARSVLDQLFTLSPERVLRVLRTLILTPRPLKWCVALGSTGLACSRKVCLCLWCVRRLFSDQIPTSAHLAWLAYMEYKVCTCGPVPVRSCVPRPVTARACAPRTCSIVTLLCGAQYVFRMVTKANEMKDVNDSDAQEVRHGATSTS